MERVIRMTLNPTQYAEWLACGEGLVKDWLVRGSRAWRDQVAREAVRLHGEVKATPSAAEVWVTDHVRLAGNGECPADRFVPMADLYASYIGLAGRLGQDSMKKVSFARYLSRLGLTRAKFCGKRGYYGIEISPPAATPPQDDVSVL